LAIVLALALSPVPSQAQVFDYVLEDLGTLPGHDSSIPWGINASGQVVGWSTQVNTQHAFLFADGAGMVELTPLPGYTSNVARAINDDGSVAGSGWGSGLPEHGMRWVGGVAQDLGAVGGNSMGWGINLAGDAVGESPNNTFSSHAQLFSIGGGSVDLTPAATSHSFDINDGGKVTGYMAAAGFRAFRWTSASGIEDLGVTGSFAHSFGRAINISGQVAGFLTSATGNTERVMRYTDGVGMVDLGGVGEVNEVWGMNAQGDFVGHGRPTSGLKRAFLYTDENGLQDLNLLIDPTTNWFLIAAHDINDSRQVVGYGINNDTGEIHAFRLTPSQSVGSLAHLALAPVSVDAGASLTAWVTLTTPAPPGGFPITILSSEPSLAVVPGSVIVPEGERNMSFPVTTMPPESVRTVTITASHGGLDRVADLEIFPATTTAVGDLSPSGLAFRLHPPFPNPAAGKTRIGFDLPSATKVRISVYNAGGRLIRVLVDEVRESGSHTVVWNGRDQAGSELPAGIYFIDGRVGEQRIVEKLVLLR
jgi:probable HAF family extracellular repeat protein